MYRKKPVAPKALITSVAHERKVSKKGYVNVLKIIGARMQRVRTIQRLLGASYVMVCMNWNS